MTNRTGRNALKSLLVVQLLASAGIAVIKEMKR